MIDFQGLLEVDKASDNPSQQVNMDDWVDDLCIDDVGHLCGTHGCLIGNFCFANVDDDLKLRLGDGTYGPEMGYNDEILTEFEAVAKRFNITYKEAEWLFGFNPLYSMFAPNDRSTMKSAHTMNKEQALSRLRKFIYYKLHKQEMEYVEGRNEKLVQPKNISGRNSAVLAAQ